MKLPLIDDPHGPFAMDVGAKASPSRMKYAGGSGVVITDDDIGGRPGARRLPGNLVGAGWSPGGSSPDPTDQRPACQPNQ
jgi:hypothetical protein